MSIHDNRKLVIDFYRLMSEFRFEEMLALMSADAVWTVAGNPETFPHAGAYSKADRAAGFLAFIKIFKSLEVVLRSTTAEDDRVVAEIRTCGETHGGLRYVNELLTLIRCSEGKIVHLYEHVDQQTTLAFERSLAQSAS